MNAPREFLQDKLRAELQAAEDSAAPTHPDLGPATVIGAGTLPIPRRSTAPAAAALAVLAVAGGIVLSQRANAPATHIVKATLTSQGAVEPGGLGWPLKGPERVEVSLDTERGTVDYVSLGHGRRSVVARQSLSALHNGAMWTTARDYPEVVFGLLPAHSGPALPLPIDLPVSFPSLRVDLPGTEYQAISIAFEGAASARSMKAIAWSGPRQDVHISDGSGFFSAVVGVIDGEPRTVFYSKRWGLLGQRSRSSFYFGSVGEHADATAAFGTGGYGTDKGSTWEIFGFVPTGAKRLRLETDHGGLSGVKVHTRPLPGTQLTAYYASQRVAPGSQPPLQSVHSVSFIDPATGTRKST